MFGDGGLFEVGGHAIEGVGEFADFVVAMDDKAGAEVAGAEAAGAGGEGEDGCGDPVGEPAGEEEEDGGKEKAVGGDAELKLADGGKGFGGIDFGDDGPLDVGNGEGSGGAETGGAGAGGREPGAGAGIVVGIDHEGLAGLAEAFVEPVAVAGDDAIDLIDGDLDGEDSDLFAAAPDRGGGESGGGVLGGGIGGVVFEDGLFGFGEGHGAAVGAGEGGVLVQRMGESSAEVDFLEDGVKDAAGGIDEEDVVEAEGALVAVERWVEAGVGGGVRTGGGGGEKAVLSAGRVGVVDDVVELEGAGMGIGWDPGLESAVMLGEGLRGGGRGGELGPGGFEEFEGGDSGFVGGEGEEVAVDVFEVAFDLAGASLADDVEAIDGGRAEGAGGAGTGFPGSGGNGESGKAEEGGLELGAIRPEGGEEAHGTPMVAPEDA